MAGKAGDVEYIIRGNDENIESDLARANKKVEQAAEKSADATIKIEAEKAKGIQAETDKIVKSADKAADDVAASWENAGKEAKLAMSDIAEDKSIEVDVTAKTEQAESKIDQVSKDKSIDVDVNGDVSDVKDAIGGLDEEAASAGRGIEKELGQAFDNVAGEIKGSFSDAMSGVVPFGDKIGDLTKGLSGTGKVATGVGVAFAGMAVSGVKTATEIDSAMNDLAAKTGLSKTETEKYQEVLEGIYANNYGEDFGDIANGIADVTKNMGEMDNASLQNVTESAFALRDTFGYEIPESTKAAKAMMEQFGLSGEEAMNLIATGSQNGLDYSGELLDSISEYSVHFEKLGLDADDMFKIFEKGAESGAFNLDKVGDSMKELSIRVLDGSDATREGFELIGLNADEMAEKFSKGGDSAKEAFEETIDALAEIEDPLAQNQAGVDLFGTMWEDLGADAVTALSEIEDGSYDVGDELERLKEIEYDDLGSMFEALGRAVEMLFLPLGESLMPILMSLIQVVLPVITELLTPLLELLGLFIEPIMLLISTALQPLIETFTFLMNEVLAPLIQILQEIFMPIFESVMNVISSAVSEHVGKMTSIFRDLIGFIKDVFTGNWKGAWDHIKNIFRTLIPGIDDVVGGIRRTLGGIVDFISGIFTGNWKKAWNGIKNIFGGIWDAMKGLFKSPINWIIGKLNSFLQGLNKIKIPDWIPGIGGKGFNIPMIPKLKVGMDYVPSDDFPALLHAGEMVLTREDAQLLRSLGGIEGVVELLSISGKEMISPAELTGLTRESEEAKAYTFTSILNMDSKEVARATSRYTDAELAKIEELTRRGV